MNEITFLEEFHWLQLFFDYCVGNRPFILPSSSTQQWKSRSDWVTDDGRPKNEYLRMKYGDLKVPVISEGDCEPEEWTFSQYIDYVEGPKKKLQYLKDFHFQESAGSSSYSAPMCLYPDWVNHEDWTSTVDSPFDGADYRFVYYGVKGTWTRFHSDVLSSHSWSANICGRKLWLFVPIGEEKRFMNHGQLINDLRERENEWKEVGGFSLIQEEGQIVFVPSNWHHQVHNLEDTISINHNVINASNLNLVAHFLFSRLIDVRKEIEHLKDVFDEEEMKEKEKLILKADARLDLDGLSQLCRLIIDSRLKRGRDCYVCWRHNDVIQCRLGSCRPLPCSCTISSCAECVRVLEEYEITVAALVLDKVTRQDQHRE